MTTFAVLGPVLHHRRPLQRSRSALDAGCLTVGFLGGSITAPKTGTRWPEPFTGWLPDGLHPEQRGSLSYAQAIIAFCEEELGGDLTDRHRQERLAMPVALKADCWDKVSRCDLTTLELTGPWSLHRWFTCLGMARAFTTNVPGATLRCAFEGRGFVLGFDFGRLSGELRYRVDGGEWWQTERDRPDWCGDSGCYRPTLVADDLPSGRHPIGLGTLTVAVPGGRGTVTTIGLLGVIH
jgi:hypothetical protein